MKTDRFAFFMLGMAAASLLIGILNKNFKSPKPADHRYLATYNLGFSDGHWGWGMSDVSLTLPVKGYADVMLIREWLLTNSIAPPGCTNIVIMNFKKYD